MRQLTALDQQFLALEELRPQATPHTKRKPAKMKADG